MSVSLLISGGQLTQKEIYVLTAIYEKGCSVSKLADFLHVSRQADFLHVSRQNVNQIKKRDEKKLRKRLS